MKNSLLFGRVPRPQAVGGRCPSGFALLGASHAFGPYGHLALCFMLLIFSFGLNGQTFIKRFNLSEVNTLTRGLLYHNDTLFLVGVMNDTSDYSKVNTFFLTADTNGNLNGYKDYRDSTHEKFWLPFQSGYLTLSTNNEILACGNASDSLGASPLLLSFNTSGDTLRKKIFPYHDAFLYHAIEMPNNAILCCGTNYKVSSGVNHYVALIDSTGSFIWEKKISKPDYQYGTCVFFDGDIITSCGYHYNGALSDAEYEFQNEIYQFDLQGNEISYWQDTDINTATTRYIRTSDGGYVSIGQKITTRLLPSTARYQGCIIKWDSTFNKVWEKTYGTENGINYLYDIEENTDGTFVACGIGGYFDADPLSNQGTGWLMRIDTNGDMLWSYHYYGLAPLQLGGGYENQLYDLAILPDGDIVAVGYAVGPGAPEGVYQQSYLLRVNSDGCFDDGTCGSPVIVSTEDAPVALPPAAFSFSPNPVRHEATLATSDTWRGGQFQVFDGLGRVVLSGDIAPPMQQISLSGLPSGMYVLVLRDTDGKTASAMVMKQ